MDIRVLGPLTLSLGGVSAVPTAAKPKQVLALLLLHPNQIVPVSSLMTELWDDSPPRSALTTLQTYVLQLRKLLGVALAADGSSVCPCEVIVTRAGGYMFRVRPGELDLHRYEQLANDGRRAMALGDHETAASSLRQALAVWQGWTLADVRAGRLLEVQIRRLEEGRLNTLQQRIELDLRLGRHHEVLSELTALTAEHRLHESLHALFMLALYRSGRRPEALAVFRRLRRTLADELGLEPSPRLQRLHQNILSAELALEVGLRDSLSSR